MNKIENNIYVIGYPKSGNTWLVRLISRILNIKIERFSKGTKDPEIASDLNEEINGSSNSRIYKLHDFPEELTNEIDNSPKYIIYIYREPKDTLISSFFYFKYKGEDKYVKKRLSIVQLINPWYIKRRFTNRAKLNDFVNLFTKGFVKGGQREHVLRWSKFLLNYNGYYAVISYEKLRLNTASSLREIFSNLNLEYDENRLLSAIEKEDINNRRDEIQNTVRDKLTFGKDFNLRFLRKGNLNDWKNYLSNKQQKCIDRYLKIGEIRELFQEYKK